MSTMFEHLKPGYQEMVLSKWAPVLDATGAISDPLKRISTAMMFENTVQDAKSTQLNEAYEFGMGAQGGIAGAAQGGGALGQTTDFGVNDSRIPTTVIPLIRRIFPELIAHDLVGVQPMATPVGFAYALRCLYGANGKGGTDALNTELGFNKIDTRFTGTSAVNALTGDEYTGKYATIAQELGLTNNSNLSGSFDSTTSASYWTAFAGDYSMGRGATLGESEFWGLSDAYPQAKFHIEKAMIEAKSRKIGTSYSLELAEDMMKMHGTNADSELVNILGYELKAEIDRQLLSEMVKAAIVDSGSVSTWSPVTADGRFQLERIGTLFTHMLLKSQQIALRTRRGSASWAVCSPTVVALLERLSDYKSWDAANPSVKVPDQANVAKVGTIRGNIQIVRDSLAAGDYVLMGYKGTTSYDTGITFNPYIPVQMLRAVDQNSFAPRIGLRTRYGIHASIWSASRYYQFIKVTGLQEAMTNGASFIAG